MKQVVIAGASGLVGGHCLRFLLAAPSIDRVTSFVRRASGISHPKLVEQVVEFDRIGEMSLGAAVDSLFCCLGTTIKKAGSQTAFTKVDLDYVVELACWGRRNGARHFLAVSSLGADPKSRVFYNRTKGRMETALLELGYPKLDIFRPSLLLGERGENRPGERFAEKAFAVFGPLLRGGLGNYRPIAAETVAAAMVGAALGSASGTNIHSPSEIRERAAPI